MRPIRRSLRAAIARSPQSVYQVERQFTPPGALGRSHPDHHPVTVTLTDFCTQSTGASVAAVMDVVSAILSDAGFTVVNFLRKVPLRERLTATSIGDLSADTS